MKSAIVPAQITTVEDKVAGSLSLSQLLLLATPVFGGTGIYILFPPALNNSPFKLVLTTIITVVFSLFAIRIKGKILLQWAVILLRYSLRPRYHVFNKNSAYLRPTLPKSVPKQTPAKTAAKKKPKTERLSLPELSTADKVKLEDIIANPQAKLHFTSGKGGLRVHITEVK